MKVLFVFSAAPASSIEGAAWLKSLDMLKARGIEPHVVLPETGDGTLAEALKQRKVKIYVRYFTSWATEASDASSSMAKAFRFATGRANKTSEKDIRAIIKEQDIKLVYVSEGTINAGVVAAAKEKVPVLWQFNQLIGAEGSSLAFIDTDAKVAQSLALATALLASNEEIAADLRGRCPRSDVRVIDPADKDAGDELFAVMRSTMAKANGVAL